jgi:hypothetical protein
VVDIIGTIDSSSSQSTVQRRYQQKQSAFEASGSKAVALNINLLVVLLFNLMKFGKKSLFEKTVS